MTEQHTPTIGRIVIYKHNEAADGARPNGAHEYPAIVTQTFPDHKGEVTYSNLLLLPPFQEPKHKGSVAHHSDQHGTWHWPSVVVKHAAPAPAEDDGA